MTDLLFADTNILVYAMDPADPTKREKATWILSAAALSRSLVTSPQTIAECYRVLTERRNIAPPNEARAFLFTLEWTCRAPLDWQTLEIAWQIGATRSYHWWDRLMLAAALRASCDVFLTEDLQSGDEIGDMLVVNPFTTNIADFFGRSG